MVRGSIVQLSLLYSLFCMYLQFAREYVILSVVISREEETMTTLQDLRLTRNMTQMELAEKLGVSDATIHRVENGSPIQRAFFMKLCAVLEVDPGDVTEVIFSKRVYRRKKKSATIE